MIARILGGTLLALIATAGLARQGPSPLTLEDRIRAAEDGRAADDAALAPILEGLGGSPDEQRLAVRALGRLEREALVPRISPLLAAPHALVRADAAEAIAQAVVSGRAAAAFAALEGRAGVEQERVTLGVLARSLGRLPYATASEVAAAERIILRIGQTLEPGPVAALADAVHGLDALARRRGTLKPLEPGTRDWLRARVRPPDRAPGAGGQPDPPERAFLRRLALSALVTLGAVDAGLAADVLGEGDVQLRRLAVLGLAATGRAEGVEAALSRAAADPSFLVRFTALRAGAQAAPASACAAARAALADRSTHVALLAIELAGQHCGGQADVIDRLAALRGATWHTEARALVSLARLAPGRAQPRIREAAVSPAWPVRMAAAGAAGHARDVATLERLAVDADPNVAEAALAALVPLAGRRADPLLVAGLGRDDPQLVRTSARLLAGTQNRAAATQAIAAALDRLSAERRETSRDARLAMLDRLEETGRGVPGAADGLRARLSDFDDAVATRAAAILAAWTGQRVEASPQPLPRAALPTAAAIARLRTAEVEMTLQGGGVVRMRLFPDEAPGNVDRFVRLVRAGYFDGLTFHRVEPGFVIQGGSPLANEYMGDGPFTRDEFGRRSHRRGTIGISTRGRDTGDGQIFVNLVDNVRLDHAYTIIGEVTAGMDVIDRILAADTIARVRLVP